MFKSQARQRVKLQDHKTRICTQVSLHCAVLYDQLNLLSLNNPQPMKRNFLGMSLYRLNDAKGMDMKIFFTIAHF